MLNSVLPSFIISRRDVSHATKSTVVFSVGISDNVLRERRLAGVSFFALRATQPDAVRDSAQVGYKKNSIYGCIDIPVVNLRKVLRNTVVEQQLCKNHDLHTRTVRTSTFSWPVCISGCLVRGPSR